MSKLENNSEVLNNILVKLGNKNFGTVPSDWILTLADDSTVTGIANVMRMISFGNEIMRITDADGIVQWECGWPSVNNALEFASASQFYIKVSTPGWDGTMEYCNGNGWKIWDGSEILSGGIDNNQRIYIRGTNNTKIAGSSSNSWYIDDSKPQSNGEIECNGNIENLLDYATVKIGEHPEMADNCYSYMFSACFGLITAPELPATTLTDYCYSYMFSSCTKLTTVPKLPATTLANHCYSSMFSNCTKLTTAPKLPATTLADYCYSSMFNGCTKLTTVPELPATTLAKQCYSSMFNGCTSLITVPKLPATTLANSCYQNMFNGCTKLTTVPELPATTLVWGCYANMFRGCIKIKLSSTKDDIYTISYRIPIDGTGISENGYGYEILLRDMFYGTGGTFTGTPVINTTYYLDSSNTIV